LVFEVASALTTSLFLISLFLLDDLKSMSPILVLLGILKIGVAIEVTLHLFPREVEVDLPLLHVDDGTCGVKERSS
jgi:hypothetical protein